MSSPTPQPRHGTRPHRRRLGRTPPPHIDDWLGQLFSDDQLDANVGLVIAALEHDDDNLIGELRRLRDEERAAQSEIDNYLKAIAEGAPAAPFTNALNQAYARVTAAQNRQQRIRPKKSEIDPAAVREALSEINGISSVLTAATPQERAALYKSVGLKVCIDHPAHTVKTALDLGKLSLGQICVEGGT